MNLRIMDGNEACSYVSYQFSELAGIYPITPASTMAETIEQWSSEGKKNFWGDRVGVVQMESEAGAIAMVHGALQNGSLATTYTASQGLLLMIPNMYKIAGELLPCVINVAARTVASHSLSILGDHQDIYAVRPTGFAMLASSSVQQVMDLTGASYLSTLSSKVPFVNFFDGFRTSHEKQKIETIDLDKLKALIDQDKLKEFKGRSLSNSKDTRGTNQNDDVFFQISEAHNKYYDALPEIVAGYLEKISEITGRSYKPFNYYGAADADRVIVAMGSICETTKEVIEHFNNLGEKLGLIEVHLYRPFSSKYFLDVLPETVKKIAVLDRTKESGAHEPLYLDVKSILADHRKDVEIVGGRYGLSSKDTTDYQVRAVYEFLNNPDKFDGFTIGINDDVTNRSLSDVYFDKKKEAHEVLIYGFGSDGMVTASSDIIRITGGNTEAYVQGYFEYDSKKSGGLTRSHLRFSKNPIKSTYYVEEANMLVCSNDNYLGKYSMLDHIADNGIFLLNSDKSAEQIANLLNNHEKRILQGKNVQMYTIDATTIAQEEGLGNKINTVLEAAIFKLSKIIPFDFAVKQMKEDLAETFANKPPEVIEKNVNAIDRALESLKEFDVKGLVIGETNTEKSLFQKLLAKEGNKVSVSELEQYVDGSFPGGQSMLEKRGIAEFLPCYNSEKCITCNQCAFVCPHAVIRPFLLTKEEAEAAPESVKKTLIPANVPGKDYMFTIGVSYKDCTGCSLCANTCPGKGGEKALVMTKFDEATTEEFVERNDYLYANIKQKEAMAPNTVKGSQFIKPKFEFSGACAGCGETPYLRLLTQLFGEELVIANATGCSSIYGGNIPGTPYSVPWANSLFEDNAEFGYGMAVADRLRKEKLLRLIEDNLDKLNPKEVFENFMKEPNYANSLEVLKHIDNIDIEEIKELKDFVATKSYWLIGGDGWAYDIGFGGLDHVLSTNENVNILVLDTEVYSNTGGQSSKSSRAGSVAKFTATGKELNRKDLAKIALTYPHVYVATISMGANMQQTIKALNEAKAYNGPSLIIAYAPCIAQGLLKGMSNTMEEEKEATRVGYFPIFRYNPSTQEFSLDSKADFSGYQDFLNTENRYKILHKLNEDEAENLLKQNEEFAKETYSFYENLSKKDKTES